VLEPPVQRPALGVFEEKVEVWRMLARYAGSVTALGTRMQPET
jgi:hypothetical protein